MHDQMSDENLGSDVPSPEETTSTEIHQAEFQNGEFASNKTVTSGNKKPDGDTSWSSLDVPKQKSKKRRRKSGSKKHRAGRNQKRKYIPFHKKTLAQQKKADEYCKKRANRQREFLRSRGIPLAPHNTNAFIMESHESAEIIDDFEWERDRFEFASTTNLIDDYIVLEDEVEYWTKAKVFLDEIRRYEKEIEELQNLNAKLEKILETRNRTLEKDFSSLDIGPSV